MRVGLKSYAVGRNAHCPPARTKIKARVLVLAAFLILCAFMSLLLYPGMSW